MQIGTTMINLQTILTFFSQPPVEVLLILFSVGGYLIVLWLLVFAGIHLLRDFKEHLYVDHWNWVLLAIDVPLLNVQTPKAVEQMFSHLAGALKTPDISEVLRSGYKQRWFSFEVISIEGYIQFLVRTEELFRDLVEAAVYAQYPDADVIEVEDYVKDIPDIYPNDTHDIWAADFGLAENDAYPIRTYREFEHNISKDTVLKDPMGAFLESFSRLGPGEQMWFQILVQPISNSWKEKAIKKIKELIGEKAHSRNGVIDMITSAPLKILEGVGDQVFGREASEGAAHVKEEEPNKIRYLTPGQSKLVEEMEKKISMIGFKTKMRGIYIARKEVFRPSRGINALVGAIAQYNIPTANSIVPTLKTTSSYFFKQHRIDHRKKLLMKAYKKRKIPAGGPPFVLNIEELATVWHFPMSHVKTPSVQKVEVKRAEPPAGLPVERMGLGNSPTEQIMEEEKKKKETEYLTDAGGGYREDMKFG